MTPKDIFCKCECPLIRTGVQANEYCGLCSKDLMQDDAQRAAYEFNRYSLDRAWDKLNQNK